MKTRTGVLLFAHGARDPHWAAPFEAVAARLRTLRPEADVRLAYLELMSPTLLEAGGGLVAAGCTAVHVLPLFLGTGGHVRKDVPRLVEEMRAAYPSVAFALHPPIGEHDAVIAAMAAAAASLLHTP